MNDPDYVYNTMEQYCSPYYDKHGLYNDGFPCPSDKYCCQNADGIKYCCLPNSKMQMNINDQSPFSNNNNRQTYIYTTLANLKYQLFNNKQASNDNDLSMSKYQNSIQSQLNTGSVSASSSVVGSSLPLIISNSTLLIGIGVALFILILVLLLLFICVCRRCSTRSSNETKKRSHHHSSSSTNNSRLCSSGSATSSSDSHSTTASSSLTTPITLNIDSNSRLMDDMHQSHHHQQQQQQQHLLQHHSLHSNNTNNYMNTMSCGSGASSAAAMIQSANMLLNLNSVSSANTTQTSLATSSHNTNINSNLLENNDLDFDENRENAETDFILYTSNNLDYLKSHSLFNSAPLNYYPSLTLTSSLKATTIDEPPPYCDTSAMIHTPQANTERFSTFIPPLFMKHEIL